MATEATQEERDAGRGYEALFVPALFAPWPPHVLDSCNIKKDAHVLDVACGTGVLTRAAAAHSGPGGRVVGLDPAPGMIAAAQEVAPHITWVEGTAENLPFEDGAFDNVVSQFGMMFFQDRQQAAREMHRVLRPGGTVATALWHAVDQNLAYETVVSVLDEHVSTAAAEAVRIPFCLGNPDEIVQLFEEAGFEDISYETKQARAKFPSTRTMIEVELRGWLPLFDIHLSETEIADVLAKSDAPLARFASSSGTAEFDTAAYIVTGRRAA